MLEPLVGLLIVATLVLSTLLTRWLRLFALSRKLIDVPNSRSSHVAPTPRGGGGAIVLATLAVLPLLAWREVLSLHSLWGFLGAGLLVATIGWLDDHRDVPARWRLLIHFAAASWALAWLDVLPQLRVLGTTFDLGLVGDGLLILYLVWLLNLYNFMDGIDGIASIEAITVCLCAAVLYQLWPGSGDGWLVAVVLAAAVCGFMFWNFPRARIFMGDAGSGFVGIMMGLLSLEAAAIAPELFWGWLILLGAFVVDATVTLIRRLMRGERVHQAHRTHAYQHAARRIGSHVPVSLVFGGVNVMWLLPVAVLVVQGWLDGAVGVLLAYAPLVWLALRYDAGQVEEVGLGVSSKA
ncbi:MAG: glycosyltransferase family 4 protein [Gemmatimonadota bacterium]